MTERTRASWLVYALGALCAGAIVGRRTRGGARSQQPGDASPARPPSRRGSCSRPCRAAATCRPPASSNLGFKTSGTVTHIYVTPGRAGRAGPAAGDAGPAERRSHARTGQGHPAVRRSATSPRRKKPTAKAHRCGLQRSARNAAAASAASSATRADRHRDCTPTTHRPPASEHHNGAERHPCRNRARERHTTGTNPPAARRPAARRLQRRQPTTTSTTTSPSKRRTSTTGSTPSNSTSTGPERDSKETSTTGTASKSTSARRRAKRTSPPPKPPSGATG